VHVGVAFTDAFPLPRDHLPQQRDFSSEVVQVLAHVVAFGTDGWGWTSIHGLPRMRPNLTAEVAACCLVLHSSWSRSPN
jgi:hypothetical protein